jgi:hypothetical protein
MSAYLTNPDHIAAIVSWYDHVNNSSWHCYNLITREQVLFAGVKEPSVSQAAIMLGSANAASIKARYPDNPRMIIDLSLYLKECSEKAKRVLPPVYDPVSIINMIRCLDYQSCEVSKWQETNAYWILQMIKNHALMKLLDSLETEKTITWDYRAPIKETKLYKIDFKNGRVQ